MAPPDETEFFLDYNRRKSEGASQEELDALDREDDRQGAEYWAGVRERRARRAQERAPAQSQP
jgi:hypothetical protein